MKLKIHIWRYDQETPEEESPWIVSLIINDAATEDPPCFGRWQKAVAFATDRQAVTEYLESEFS